MSPKDIEELKALSRKELQALAKENGLKANLSSSALIDSLSTILFPEVEEAVVEPTAAVIPTITAEPECNKCSEDDHFTPSIGDEVETLIGDEWTGVTIKRINKTSYRVVLSDNSEITVKFDSIRKCSVKENIAEEIAVEQDAVEVIPDTADNFEEIDPSEEATALSCIEDSLQEYSFHVLDNDDLEDDQEVDDEDFFDANDEMIVDPEDEEVGELPDISTPDEEEVVVDGAEVTESIADTAAAAAASTSSVAFDASVALNTAVKKTAFGPAPSNPFSRLTAKTPTKSSNPAAAAASFNSSKVTFHSGHKTAKNILTASSRSSIAVSSSAALHHSASKTPKPSRQTIHGKTISSNSAAAATAVSVVAAAPTVTKTPTAPKVTNHTPAFAVKMTKAQQMRTEAVSHKITHQAAEESTQFQFKTLGSSSALAATNAIKPTIGGTSTAVVAKTPATAAVVAVKSRPGSVVPSVATAGSTKRKLTQSFAAHTVGAGSNISSHIDTAASATPAAAAATATTPGVKKSYAPDFAKIHSAQFSHSKSISSMVIKNKAIGVKMTNAFEAEMSGTGAPTFNIGSTAATTTAATAAAPHSVKSKQQPFSRSVSTSRARPSVAATASAAGTHRSSSVTVASSRAAAPAPTPSAATSSSSSSSAVPGSVVSFAKTPVKSVRASITTGDKENLIGSVNKKFINNRRASHFAGKAKGDLRDIRRGSYMDASADKRQQSASKARKISTSAATASMMDSVTVAAVEDEPTVMEMEEDLIVKTGGTHMQQTFAQSMSPGPFSGLKSPLEF